MENSIQQLKMQGFSYEERFANFYLTDTCSPDNLTKLFHPAIILLFGTIAQMVRVPR